jgi:hypothetical protein
MDVAIRGTVNLRNAVSDIEFLKRRSPALGIFLHSGFEEVATALYADLKPRLRKGWTIRVAGHSLGAAEAIIVGMLLANDGFPVEKVLASAPPKVTDAEGWSRFAGLAVIRLAGPFDPVPFLPPRAVLYGRDPYVQGGRLLYSLDGKKACVLDGAFFDDLPDGDLPGPVSGDRLDAKDHALLSYMRRLLPKTEGLELVDQRYWRDYALPTPP